MATIKSFTSLEQSRKLAEILPIESADMFWLVVGNTPRVHVLTEPLSNYSYWENYPCWSLAALLSVLPRIEHLKPFIDLGPKLDSDEVAIYYHSEDSPYIVRDNPVDACYDLILKLHELNLL